MKAAVLYAPHEQLKIEEFECGEPGSTEVLVKMGASGVCHSDWHVIKGDWDHVPLPSILGHEGAGVVEAVGKNVEKFPGDRVFGDVSESGFGGFAEYVCAREDALIHKPIKMTFEEAAAIPHAAMLAVQGLIDTGKIQGGQKILINGAGGGCRYLCRADCQVVWCRSHRS